MLKYNLALNNLTYGDSSVFNLGKHGKREQSELKVKNQREWKLAEVGGSSLFSPSFI